MMKPRNVNKSQPKTKPTACKKKHTSESKENTIVPPSSKRTNGRNSSDFKGAANQRVRSRSTSPFGTTKREESSNGRISARKDQKFIQKLFCPNKAHRNILGDKNQNQSNPDQKEVLMQKIATKNATKNCKQIFSHTAVLKENNKRHRDNNNEGLFFKNASRKTTRNDTTDNKKKQNEELKEISKDFVFSTSNLVKKCKEFLSSRGNEQLIEAMQIVDKKMLKMAQILGIQSQLYPQQTLDRMSFGAQRTKCLDSFKKGQQNIFQTQSLFNNNEDSDKKAEQISALMAKNKKCHTETLKIPLEQYMCSLQATKILNKQPSLSRQAIQRISLLESQKLNCGSLHQAFNKQQQEAFAKRNSLFSSSNTLIFNSNTDIQKASSNNLFAKNSIYNSNNMSDTDESQIFKIVSQRNAQLQDNTYRKEDQEIYIAIRGHVPTNEHEICLRAGERVTVLKKDNMRWLGFKDGRVGYFPRLCLFD